MQEANGGGGGRGIGGQGDRGTGSECHAHGVSLVVMLTALQVSALH